ncbi:Tad domain-containing protein [Agromyces sp. SYSU T00194]|uniref:Tad domain-containing protein n=1 Tax=Agromyces chitinivorans TaxID=3158560 RepID=UPI0033952062
MRWLKARLHDLRRERGANAVLIALLFVPLMGAGAIAVDVGALHAERAQLQHGADAAALAIAKSCGASEAVCSVDGPGIAESFVDGNAGTPVDGTATIDTINYSQNFVRVSASGEFPHLLAGFLFGGGAGTTTVSAGAASLWGSPIKGGTIPLAVAECELTRNFDPGTEETGDPFILMLIGPGNGAKNPEECGPNYPGGFGWLEGDDIDGDGSPDCVVEVEVGVPEQGVPGSSDTKAGGCPDDYLADVIGQTVLVPIYDSFTPDATGNHGSYNIARFAAFEVTGYHIASGSCQAPGQKTGNSCYLPGESNSPGFAGGEFGLQGYFVRYVEIGEDFELGDSGTPDGGLTVIRLLDYDDPIN